MPHPRVLLVVLALLFTPACSSKPHVRAKPHPGGAVPGSSAARYLELATAANSTIDAAKGRLRVASDGLTATEDDLRSIASAKREFDRGLRALTFPASEQPAVKQLLDADAELERRIDEAAAVASVSALDAASPGVLDAGVTTVDAAGRVRQLLGLPPLA